MSADLSVIIVSWNVRPLLRRCLESLERSEQVEFINPEPGTPTRPAPSLAYRVAVTVVDNASTDGSAEMVRSLFPWARLIALDENLGFTAANNLVMEEQLRSSTPPAYFLLLNPDTEVAPDALYLMLDFISRHPEVGALGPMLLNSDGSVQSSRRRFPTFATGIVESTIIQWRLWKDNPILRRYYVLDRSDYELQEVDWVTGACIMVRREAVEAAGLLDEGFFMYSEELDWCRRIKAHGFKVVYFPPAKVVHHSAQSSEQVKTFQHIQFQRSKLRYFRKHHGLVTAWTLRLFLLLNYLALFLEEAIKWIATRRSLHRERMRSYWEVLSYLAQVWPKESGKGKVESGVWR